MHADDLMAKWMKEMGKIRDRIASQDVLLGPLDTQIATTPYEVVYTEDRVKLKHYRPADSRRLQTPLLVVYALINRETMLDLQPGRSVVENFLNMGIDVYMIDWGYPTRKDRYLTIDDHVNGYMDNAVDCICDRHAIPEINLMGICMGGTFAIIYAALHAEKIKNLVTTVAPSNFDTDQGLLHVWAKGMDFAKIIDAYGNMPGDLLNLCFLLLNPARLVIDKYVGLLENINNKDFIENFVRMEKWIFDSPDVPGETIRQFIEDCYQKNLLIQSKMEVGGKRVDLRNITMPLLNIYAKYDHLVPPGACDLLTSRVGARDVQDLCIDTGHIGIYVSSKSQQQFTPKIAQWLKERDAAPRSRPETAAQGKEPEEAAQKQAMAQPGAEPRLKSLRKPKPGKGVEVVAKTSPPKTRARARGGAA